MMSIYNRHHNYINYPNWRNKIRDLVRQKGLTKDFYLMGLLHKKKPKNYYQFINKIVGKYCPSIDEITDRIVNNSSYPKYVAYHYTNLLYMDSYNAYIVESYAYDIISSYLENTRLEAKLGSKEYDTSGIDIIITNKTNSKPVAGIQIKPKYKNKKFSFHKSNDLLKAESIFTKNNGQKLLFLFHEKHPNNPIIKKPKFHNLNNLVAYLENLLRKFY